MVVAVHEYSFWNLKSDELGNLCELSVFEDNVGVFDEVLVLIVESNVYGLLSVDLISILAESLSYLKACYYSFIVSVLVGELIWPLRSKPLISPRFQIQVTFCDGFIISFLQASNELV